jgi:3-oxoacyl-[acyl-carrier-protein] synthase-1
VASATKGWTGHALGAAGIVEAVLCLYALDTGLVPGTLNTRTPEADFNLVLDNTRCEPEVALSNSFGFGGNNCSLVFGST